MKRGWMVTAAQIVADATRHAPLPGSGAALSAGVLPLLHATPPRPATTEAEEAVRLVREREFWSAYLSMNQAP